MGFSPYPLPPPTSVTTEGGDGRYIVCSYFLSPFMTIWVLLIVNCRIDLEVFPYTYFLLFLHHVWVMACGSHLDYMYQRF